MCVLYVCVCVLSHSVMSDSFLTQWTVYSIRLLYPKDSPGKNTGMGCHTLLQKYYYNINKSKNQQCWRFTH